MGAAPIADVEQGVVARDEPDIDDVLYSLRPAPFTFEDMREFLKSEFNEENIRFWGYAEEFRQRFEGFKAPKAIRVGESMDDKDSAKKKILETFIKPGAEEEVNISDKQRKEVLGKAEEEGSSKGLFENAQEEVKRLMETDSFPRFLTQMSSTNITTEQANWRKRFGILLILLGVAVTGGVIALEVVNILGTPLVRLANLLIFIGGISYYISGKQKV